LCCQKRGTQLALHDEPDQLGVTPASPDNPSGHVFELSDRDHEPDRLVDRARSLRPAAHRPRRRLQGFAKETDDPAIVAATSAKPGVVLRRPVGSDGTFTEHAKLPKELPVDKVTERTTQPRAKTKESSAQKVDDQAAREAALALEKERKRRDRERRKAEAARKKERKRREQAIAKAEAALEEAKRDHETKVEEIKRDRAALDRRSEAEDARWTKQKEKLETALRRVRDLAI
jgi:colicin import membrane protein